MRTIVKILLLAGLVSAGAYGQPYLNSKFNFAEPIADDEWPRWTGADGILEGLTDAEVRTALSLVIGTNVQAWDADLDTWATLTPSANWQTYIVTPSLANWITLLAITGTADATTYLRGDGSWQTVAGGSFDIDALTDGADTDISVNDRFVISDDGTEKKYSPLEIEQWIESLTLNLASLSVVTFNADELLLADANASPNSVGEFNYDNLITGLDDGGLVWYDDDEIRTIVDLAASETLDSGDDGHLVRFVWNSGNGYFDLVADGAGGETNDLETQDPPNVLDDEVYVGTGAGAGNWVAIPDSDGATQKLQYDTTTGAFSAGTDDDVPEAGDFAAATDLDSNGALNANSVADNEVDYSAVTLADFTNDAGFLTAEANNLETNDPPNVADDEVYVGTGAGAGNWIAIPDTDGATQKLQYDQATGAFSAGTDDDVPESGDFGAAADLDASGEVADDSHNHVITNIDAFTEAQLETQVSNATDVFTNNDGALDDDDITDDAIGSLSNVVLTSPSSGQVLEYNGSNWVNATDDTGGGGANLFETINAPNGTDPVADSTTDTLNFTEGQDITITGTASTDTIDIAFDGDLTAGTTLNGASIQTGTDDDIPESGDFGAAADLDASGEVADDSHNHVITNIDAFNSLQLRTQLTDETGSGAAVFVGGSIGAATATTAAADDNDTSVATTAFVQGEIGRDDINLIDVTGSFASPITSNPYDLDTADCWGGTVFYGATGEIDLDAGVTGQNVIIYNTGAFTITIDPDSGDDINREGTDQADGVSITLSSGAGNYVALLFDGASWITLGYKGTLAAGS